MILVCCTKVTQRPLDGLYDVEFRMNEDSCFECVLAHPPIIGEIYSLKIEGRFPAFSVLSDTTEDIIQFRLADVIFGRC